MPKKKEIKKLAEIIKKSQTKGTDGIYYGNPEVPTEIAKDILAAGYRLTPELTLKNKYKEALEDMVWQFAYRRGGMYLSTGGLSALEGAFEALGWDDPYEVKDPSMECDIEGCHEFRSPQITWGGVYVLICDKHFHDYLTKKPLPKLKELAIKREASRDPVTGFLPPLAHNKEQGG